MPPEKLGSSFRTYVAKQQTVGGEEIGGTYKADPNTQIVYNQHTGEPEYSVYTGPQPVQQTTTSMRTTAAQNSAALDATIAGLGTGQQPSDTSNGQVNIVRDQDNGDGTRTVTYSDGKTARVSATTNADGTQSYKELSPEEDIKSEETRGIEAALADFKKNSAFAKQQLDSIRNMSTAATNALIDSINQMFSAEIAEMEDTNRRILRTKQSAGIRSGRARYTAETHTGVLTDEMQKGIMRVTNLKAQMLNAIAKAEQARADKDLELFNAEFEKMDKLKKDLSTEVQNIHQRALAGLKELRDQKKAELDAEKTQLDINLDKSERAAPAIAKQLAGFKSIQEKTAFLTEYASITGIPLDILMGDVETYLTEKEKADLDIANVKNMIYNRNRSEDRQQRESTFNPSTDERALVGKYLAKNGTDEEVELAKTDSDFFYFILSKAEAEEL